MTEVVEGTPDAATGEAGTVRRRALAAGATMGILVAVAAGAVALRPPDPGPALATGDAVGRAVAGAAPPTTSRPAPSMSVAVNVTMPPLPLPEQLPADYYADVPEQVIGRIKIPKFGVDEPLQVGMTLTAINRGPGWWEGTALPGELGNMVIAGHRTTYSRPFNRIDELVEGDQVIFSMPDRDYVYAVRGVIVVPQDHIGIAAQTYAHTATLFACHPKGSASHRIVAKLRLLAPDGTPVDKDEWLPPVDQGLDDTGTTLIMRNPEGTTPTTATPPLLPDTEATTTP